MGLLENYNFILDAIGRSSTSGAAAAAADLT